MKSLTNNNPRLFLLLISICIVTPGLWALEFFRHTEADRVLIATEMVKSGNFIVPHLLGTPIFTKPPLFYWLLASFIALFGSNIETVVRLPSALLAIALVQVLFEIIKRSKVDVDKAFLASLILITCPLYLQHTASAEIDLTFSAFVSISLFFILLSSTLKKESLVLLAYFFCGLAALTKGPVAIGIVFIVDFFWLVLNWKEINLKKFFISRLVSLLVLLLVLASWFYPALLQVDSKQLFEVLNSEVLRRFESSAAREKKGLFFYPESLLVGTLPWSPFAVYSAIKLRKSLREVFSLPIYKFSLLCAGLIFIVLSIAHGKASRYSLPIYPFVAIVFAPLVQSAFQDFKLKFDRNLALFFFVGMIAVASTVWCNRYPNSVPQILGGSFLLLSGMMMIKCREKSFSLFLLPCILYLGFFIRYCETVGFSPHRNQAKSVRPEVEQIAKLVKENSKSNHLYGLEFADRWYSYYLSRIGISTTLLHPDSVTALNPDEQILLILEKEDEAFRIAKLSKHDPNIKTFEVDDNCPVILVATSKAALKELKLQSGFPVDLTLSE